MKILYIISGHSCREPEAAASCYTKNLSMKIYCTHERFRLRFRLKIRFGSDSELGSGLGEILLGRSFIGASTLTKPRADERSLD